MSFDDGCAALLADARLRRLAGIALPRRIFAVGGCVRDAALGRATKDLDVVIESDAERVAEAAAERMSARLVRLGREKFTALRLVDAEGWIDLWDLRGTDLESDLWRRDLTINAIAIDATNGSVRDPAGGRTDLERRCLRATRPSVFLEDPLRVLRLIRFTLTLPGFSIDPPTAEAARCAAPGIREVATERVRDELDRILGHPDLSEALRGLLEQGLAPVLFGPGSETQLRELVLRSSREAGGSSASPAPSEHLHDEKARLPSHWARVASELESDSVGAEERLFDFSRRGLLSRSVRDRAADLLRPAWVVPADEAEARLWLHEAGGDWPEAVRLRRESAEGAEELAAWHELDRWLCSLPEALRTEIIEPRPFLDGESVQQRLGIGPGPRVGQILAALRRAQVLGMVIDRAGAEKFLDSCRGADRDV